MALDGLAYLAHVLMHQLPPAWRFHRVHHSDPHVDVTTAFRQHPLETLWRHSFVLAGVLVLGASSGSVAIYRPPRAGEVIACGLDDLDGAERQRTSGLLALPFE